MHKQLHHKATWKRRKSVLLFVLFFSILLISISLYLFTLRNKWLEEDVTGSHHDFIQPDNYNGWALSMMVTAIFLLLSVIFALLKEMRNYGKINDELPGQKEHQVTNNIAEAPITPGKQVRPLHVDPVAEQPAAGSGRIENQHISRQETANKELCKPGEYVLSDILKKGQKIRLENSGLSGTKNNASLSLSNSSPLLFNVNRNSAGAALLLNDISEKKESEKRLKESEIFNKRILDSLNSHIVVINAAGTIVKVNKAWNAFALNNGIVGLEKCREGANYFSLCKNLDNMQDGAWIKASDGIKNIFDGILDEFHLEYPLHPVAEERWFYMRAMKLESAETLVVIEHHDITERKKAEEKTLKALEQYDILLQATSDTIWDWDIPHNQMVYNTGITKMFGYRLTEVDNAVEWWKKNIHPDDLPGVSEALADVFKKGIQNLQLKYRFRCAGGSFKYIYDRAFVIYDAHGGPTRIIGAMQDVTYEAQEEKRIAKAIIDAEERERRYIGQELHDNVNQILAGTLLTIAMAKQKKADANRIAELIHISEGYLVHAIDEVRKLSHKLAPASFEEMTLKEIFEDLLIKINIDNKFKIEFHFDEIINVLTNEDIQINLYRILQEQVKNILKYSEADTIEINVLLTGNTVQMKTFDNGKGFDLKTVKKGIGLSNIKKRVESLSGKYVLNSAPGKGCEIIIEMPLDDHIEVCK